MRRKTRLVFAELECELSIIPHYQMLSILGGGNVNTIEQAVQWAQSMGIPFTVDGQNQYKDSGGNILLSPVDVHAWANNPFPNNNPYSTTTVPSMAPTEMEIKRAYAQYFESLGYEMIENDDGTFYCASRPYQESTDPWKRVNGELVVTPTIPPTTTAIDYIGAEDYDNVILTLQKVIVKDKDNKDIFAYEVISYKTSLNGPEIYDIPDKYKSNCHGSAMGIDLWIHDPYETPTIYEDSKYQEMMNNNYSSNETNATIVSYFTNGGTLIHSIRTDPSTGEVWSKSEVGEVKKYDNLQDFYNDNNNEAKYADKTKKYYKL